MYEKHCRSRVVDTEIHVVMRPSNTMKMLWMHTHMFIHSQHLSHWGPSTVHTGLPGTLQSGWSSSCGLSTLSGHWCTAHACMHPEHWQTAIQRGDENKTGFTTYAVQIHDKHTHRSESPNLCPTSWKPRVSPDTTQQVEFALSVATQVDGSWGDVDVHEVVDYSALYVVLDPVHQVSAANVEDLDVR